MPNYFGLQRFGATRPVTHLVGECILHGDFEKAVITYIGLAFPWRTRTCQICSRTAFSTSRDIQAALADLPRRCRMSGRCSTFFILTPKIIPDTPGVSAKTPLDVRLRIPVIYLQLYVSQRLEDGHTLTEPLAGDRLIFANGRTDTVTGTNRSAVSLHIRRRRCSIALFIQGKEPVEAQGEGERATLPFSKNTVLTRKDFERASEFLRTKFDGAWRAVALRTDVKST